MRFEENNQDLRPLVWTDTLACEAEAESQPRMRLPKIFTAHRPAARSPFAVPRSSMVPAGQDRSTKLRAVWPTAPDVRSDYVAAPRHKALAFPSRKPAVSNLFTTPKLKKAKPQTSLDLSFAQGPERAARIARGLRQAGILVRPDQPLLRLPTYSVLRGQLGQTQALKGKHLLSQKEWAFVWLALNVHHHGLGAVPTKITRMPMEMRYDFFVAAGLTHRPEESRHWVHELRDAGVLSRRLHLKSFAALPRAAQALGLTAEDPLMIRMADSLFVLPQYTPNSR